MSDRVPSPARPECLTLGACDYPRCRCRFLVSAAGSSVPDTSGQPETDEGGIASDARGAVDVSALLRRVAICRDLGWGAFKAVAVRDDSVPSVELGDALDIFDRQLDNISGYLYGITADSGGVHTPATEPSLDAGLNDSKPSGLPAVREPDEAALTGDSFTFPSVDMCKECGNDTHLTFPSAHPGAPDYGEYECSCGHVQRIVSVREPDEAALNEPCICGGDPDDIGCHSVLCLEAKVTWLRSDRDTALNGLEAIQTRAMADLEAEVAVLTARLETAEWSEAELARLGTEANEREKATEARCDALTTRLTEAEKERAAWEKTLLAVGREHKKQKDRAEAAEARLTEADEALSDPSSVARAFHEAYERLAPEFGYHTRRESAVPWEDVPEPNRSLMVAVAEEVCTGLRARAALEAAQPRQTEDTGVAQSAPSESSGGEQR